MTPHTLDRFLYIICKDIGHISLSSTPVSIEVYPPESVSFEILDPLKVNSCPYEQRWHSNGIMGSIGSTEVVAKSIMTE